MIGKMIKINNYEILKIIDKVSMPVASGNCEYVPCDKYIVMERSGKTFDIHPYQVTGVFRKDFDPTAIYIYKDDVNNVHRLKFICKEGRKIIFNLVGDKMDRMIIDEFDLYRVSEPIEEEA